MQICSEYYQILVQRDPSVQRAAFGRLTQAIKVLFAEHGETCVQRGQRHLISPSRRPLPSVTGSVALALAGRLRAADGGLTAVDCTLAPHALRLYVLEAHRGLALDRTDPCVSRVANAPSFPWTA